MELFVALAIGAELVRAPIAGLVMVRGCEEQIEPLIGRDADTGDLDGHLGPSEVPDDGRVVPKDLLDHGWHPLGVLHDRTPEPSVGQQMAESVGQSVVGGLVPGDEQHHRHGDQLVLGEHVGPGGRLDDALEVAERR